MTCMLLYVFRGICISWYMYIQYYYWHVTRMQHQMGVSIHWTGLLERTTGLSYFPFLDKCLCLFLERKPSYTFLQLTSTWLL